MANHFVVKYAKVKYTLLSSMIVNTESFQTTDIPLALFQISCKYFKDVYCESESLFLHAD